MWCAIRGSRRPSGWILFPCYTVFGPRNVCYIPLSLSWHRHSIVAVGVDIPLWTVQLMSLLTSALRSLCTNTTSNDLTGMCVVATLVAAGVDRPAFTPELVLLIGCSSLVVIVRPCSSLARLHRLARGSHNWVVGTERESGPAAGLFHLALPLTPFLATTSVWKHRFLAVKNHHDGLYFSCTPAQSSSHLCLP